MKKKYNQISTTPGFMKHNGGLLFRKINSSKYEFKTKIKLIHLNKARITHGGYICSIIDAGMGTAAHQATNSNLCVTIKLDINFISATFYNDYVKGEITLQKKTTSLVFLSCLLKSNNKIISTASGIWKIKKKTNINNLGG